MKQTFILLFALFAIAFAKAEVTDKVFFDITIGGERAGRIVIQHFFFTFHRSLVSMAKLFQKLRKTSLNLQLEKKDLVTKDQFSTESFQTL
jgi:hypothetical protein